MYDFAALCLNSLLILVVCTNALPERLNLMQILCIFSQIYLCLILFSSWGQAGTYPIMFGTFLLIFIFSTAKLLNLYCAVLMYLLNVVLNHYVLSGLYLFTKLNAGDLYGITSIIFMVCFLILVICVTSALGWLLRSRLKIQQMHFSTGLLTAGFLNIAAGAALFIFHFSYAERIGYPPRISRINTALFSVYFLFSFTSSVMMLHIQRKENALKMRLEKQKQMESYVHTLELLHQDMRSFRHDYQNILSTMEGYLMDNDFDGLKHWFHHSIVPLSEQNFSLFGAMSELSKVKIPELKGLLYTKGAAVVSSGISLQLDIPYPVTALSADVIDVCTILGIFLDNAAEEVENRGNGTITVSILQEDTVSVLIRNTCPALPLPLSDLSADGVSTKGSGRGHGLAQVENLLKKYPLVFHTCTWRDQYFEQSLENL